MSPTPPSPPVPDALTPLVHTDTALEHVETVPDAALLHAQLAAVVDEVDDVRKRVRARLDELALAAADGDGLSRRIDGVGTVIVDRPNATHRVADPVAFAAYCDRLESCPFEVESVRRVTVDPLGHEHLADAIAEVREQLAPPAEVDDLVELPYATLDRLCGPLQVTEQLVVPEDALEQLEAAGLVVLSQHAVVDLDTGERVPGVATTPPRAQRVSIRADKAAGKLARAQVRRALRALAAARADAP